MNLYLIRGICGSGKSTLAESIIALNPEKIKRISADDFFSKYGTEEYRFNSN